MIAGAVLALAAAVLPTGGQAETIEGPRVPDRPSYTYVLRSNAGGSRWEGHGAVSFRNDASAPLAQVDLRLWGNGARGCLGDIRVRALRGGSAGRLERDCTLLPVTLAKPLAPGARATLRFKLKITVPPRNDRFGRVQDEVAIGNALPVLGVTDSRGPQRPPYVAFGESFYTQVATWNVTLDAPARLALPATGQLMKMRPAAGKRLIRTYRAEQSRDFAWLAGPYQPLQTRTRDGVAVRLWARKGTDPATRRVTLQWAKRAMATFDDLIGPYPYGEVDVVLMAFTAFGGMEYPGLVMANPTPVVISHELAHQWWYAVVGNDQYSEPWLDEGFTTWLSVQDVGEDARRSCALGWPSEDASLRNDMGFYETRPRTYGWVVYTNGSCALTALEGAMGREQMLAFMRDYWLAHRFGFSTTDEFLAAAEAAAGISLAEFRATWRLG